MSVSVLPQPREAHLDDAWKTLHDSSTEHITKIQLRDLWAQILQQDPSDFSEQDAFFEVGGDSITALDLATATQAQDIRLTVEQIFMHVTLEEMAKEALATRAKAEEGAGACRPLESFELLCTDISRADNIQAIGKACGVAAERVENAYPCTPMQESLVMLSDGDENFSVRQLVHQLANDVPLDRFQQAWAATVHAHPVLRTRIYRMNGELRFIQAVLDEEMIWNTSTSDLPQFLEQDAGHLMKLGDRFFRYTIVLENENREDARGYFVRTVHHALCDAASLLAILDDVAARFFDELTIERPPFEQFIESINRTNSSESSTFGSKLCPALITLERPITLVDRPPIGLIRALLLRAAWGILLSHHTGTESIVFGVINSGKSSEHPPSPTKTIIDLPLLDIAALSAFSAKHSITPASIFDAAWAQTLSIYTGSTDIAFEYVVSGRDQEVPSIFEIVGPVMNLLTYHLHDISTEDSAQALATLAHQMQEQRLQDGPHNACNLWEVLENELKGMLLFNTALNFQRRPLGVQTDTLRAYDCLELSKDPWHFDVLVRVIHIMDDDMVRPSVKFDAQLFDENRMKEVADVFWRKVQIAVS